MITAPLVTAGTVFLLHALTARSLTIPTLAHLTSSNITLGAQLDRCTFDETWAGDGIDPRDCGVAIRELKTGDVQPRRGREYEFYTHGAPLVHNPDLANVITPRSHEFSEYYAGNRR